MVLWLLDWNNGLLPDDDDDDDDEIAYFTVRWKTRASLSTAPKTWDNTDKDSPRLYVIYHTPIIRFIVVQFSSCLCF